jgi:hypothetical protein
MPLVPFQMQSLIQLKAASLLMAGSKLPDIVSAVSAATCQYLIASSVVNSTNVVLGPGAGTQTGTVTGLVPQAMSSLMFLKATAQGLAGQDLPKLFDAISFGVCTSIMTTVVVQGTVIGGGPGMGTGKIIGLIPIGLETLIFSQAAFRLISGSKIREIISSIAFGICNHILSVGTVILTDIGAFAPPPVGPIPIPAAPGIGRFV